MNRRSLASQMIRKHRARRRWLAWLICLAVVLSSGGCFGCRPAAYAETQVRSPLTLHVPEPNIYADLEAAVLWEQSFAQVKLSGNWAEDLLAIARTQLGYTESSENFDYILNAAGDGYVILGWTRYGAWYGYPYGDWCAMFVSFCLHYAGIGEESFPYECQTNTWVNTLRQLDRFSPAGDYTPKPGDLIFFDRERDQVADHVGIVCEVREGDNSLRTIEGNRSSTVGFFDYTLDDRIIMGYGILPENPNFVEKSEAEETKAPDVKAAEPVNLDASTEHETADTTEQTEAPEETPVPMPPQDFEHGAGGVLVEVSASEGAFPEGSWMYVTPVNGNLIRSTVAEAVDGEVLEVQAVDIKFYNAARRVIDPQIPIRVTITPVPSQYDDRSPCLVHIDDAGEADLIDLAEEVGAGDRELVFEAKRFSIFAVTFVSEEPSFSPTMPEAS